MYKSSRLGRANVSAINATATGFSTAFGSQTRQVRVETGTPVWLAMFQSTGSTTDFVSGTSTSTTAIVGTYLGANEWDYFSVTPGTFLCWRSTSTSTTGFIQRDGNGVSRRSNSNHHH